MAPIRRYLRITKYSVLECRIYVENPALAESWLLNSRNPVLPRVIESVRPLVLPKLREENERSRAKGGRKKGVKDVVAGEDFEVSIFLTEMSTRHSLLTKHKHFRETKPKQLISNSQKLTGNSNDDAIEVDDIPPIQREDSEDDGLDALHEIPLVAEADADSLFVGEDVGPRTSKRSRASIQSDSQPESLSESEPSTKRRKDTENDSAEFADDKKKMAMDVSYEGFSIYGRVLCLVVKRKDNKGKRPATDGSHAMMEEWITATQMPPPDDG
ncbi:hypothetical protein HYFRA_00008138 [Hymenoscyphus fraxineus]|uniref:Uncharacterized protein n=1 Tax=Hymenoscyphus fraxineus TaxID=746836 RepID=A0A9N9LA07_9HELO|nr:hypothetical protein HYFRA_00008138 [Hymenoscyphus fraxineus]